MLQHYEDKVKLIKTGKYYGIDLGTTYTVIAVVDMSEAREMTGKIPVKRIAIEQFSPFELTGSERTDMVASVLGVRNDNRMFVGNRLYQLKGHPDYKKDINLFYHWKLDLGISEKPLYKNAVMSEVDDASKVAGKILNYCRLQLTNESTGEWENVMVTVPASFQPNQRNDVMTAIEYARIKKDKGMLLDEPNAAFIGYMNQLGSEEKYEMLKKPRNRVLVIDFGGGTCDLSILELQTPEHLVLKMSNLAISRYNDLGGQDLDMMIAEEFLLPLFLHAYEDEVFESDEIEGLLLPQLAVQAERLKIDLSRIISARFMKSESIPDSAGLVSIIRNASVFLRNKQYTIDELVLNFNDFRKVTGFLFTENEFRLQVVDKVIRSVPAVVNDILEKANLSYVDIDFVLFVGGSVQNLIFVQECMRLFKQAMDLLPQRPDMLVAEGAAVYSFYRNALGVELLQPICSDTVGVAIHNQPFFPLIHSGTLLPVTIDLPSFGIQSERQHMLRVPFCIGDAKKIVNELSIDIPQWITRQDVITIKATLSENKLLQVEVKAANRAIGSFEMSNPFQLANVSDEQRQLYITTQELDKAKSRNDRNKEKSLMRSLIHEYYGIGNYTRVLSMGAEWLEKFDPMDVNMNNMMFCAHDQLGNRKRAENYLNVALKYSPENETLIYNKFLVKQKSEGVKEALNYLKTQPERVLQKELVRFQLALLEYNTGNRKPAGEIAEEYNQGGFEYVTGYNQKRMLKKIVGLYGFPLRSDIEVENQHHKINFNEDDLLRINTMLNE